MLGGRYRLLDRLGEGGMSVIWRARDEVLGRDVAVKVLSARFAGDPSSRQRVRAEAQAVAKLSHAIERPERGFEPLPRRVPLSRVGGRPSPGRRPT